jgi:hypothetical protein
MIGPVQHFPRYRGLLEEMQRSACPGARRCVLPNGLRENLYNLYSGTHGRR